MKKLFTIPFLLVLFVFTSCKSAKQKNTLSALEVSEFSGGHNSMNALDWSGTYTGVIPCADCEGIKTTIILNSDLTYELHEQYLGKSTSVLKTQGSFKWGAQGQRIILSDVTRHPYFVGENVLIKLDNSGHVIAGDLSKNYTLQKQQNTFLNTKWQLKTLMGKDVSDKEIFIIFSDQDNHVFGHAGCNTFQGDYQLNHTNGIVLSKLIKTLRACLDMEVETTFFKALEKVDNYTLNGTTLSFSKAKMAHLMVFEAFEINSLVRNVLKKK